MVMVGPAMDVDAGGVVLVLVVLSVTGATDEDAGDVAVLGVAVSERGCC